MVILLRVDGRLMHGMIASYWTGETKANVIVVANDEAANDEFRKMTIKLGKPGGTDLYVWTKEKAVDRINGSKYANKRILMTVASIEDAVYMIKNCPSIKVLNLGEEVDRNTEGKIPLTVVGQSTGNAVWLNKEKYLLLKEVHDSGVDVYAQISPQMTRINWEDIETKIKKHFQF